MNANPNLAEVVSLMADASRAAMLTCLLDKRFYTASELAYAAGVTPQTASFHLAKLVEGGMVKVEKHGRHRYFQLADEEVAYLLESLLSLSRPPEVRSLKQSIQMRELKQARMCYDHLAGLLGVQLTGSLVRQGWLETLDDEQNFQVTARGETFFAEFGLDLKELGNRRRAFSRKCLDWSERQHHLAGALGSAVASRLLQLGWIKKRPSSRAIEITADGSRGLQDVFGIRLEGEQ
ncbi:winged helix-turn-helix domain-containing protein [Brevibacillus humidisoli]|uniref:ArsR/SmtB family transcription factor n=1 Tax=Brevibacillus humidisoli TaxID=2895522 RepID=UPI001E370E2C|nr:winged helix-turn-helix domain-containing protein [Brevibacillus humidisoli]UFJ41162.1 winged helix-turn-helix domain-containing protein [Brevibacillus humidisoli]